MTPSSASPRRRVGALCWVVLAAVGLRALFFAQLEDSPAVWQHGWADSDMHFFDAWGRRIADGDLLTDGEWHPYHGWHAEIAEQYLSDHPERRAELEAAAARDGDERPAGHRLWDGWFGGKQLHQEPLYPYMIAATYSAVGADVRWVFAWQLLLGAGSVVLLYLIARRHFSERAGRLTALLALGYGPLLLYEMVLLRTTLLVFAGLLLVQLTSVAQRRDSWRAWGVLGLACGLAFTLKTTFAVFWLGAMVWASLRARPERRRAIAGLALGFGLAWAPVVVRNVAVGAPAFGLTSVGPLNVVLGLSPDSSAQLLGFDPNVKTFADVMGRTDGEMLPVLRETLGAHDEPWTLMGLFAARLANVLHWFEAPNNVNFYYYRLHAPALRLAVLDFRVVAPLALLGLALACRRARRHWPLLLLAGGALLPLIAFGTLARYRILLAAALLPFAGFALAELWRWATERRIARTAGALAAVVLLGAWVARPLPAHAPRIRAMDYVVPFETFYNPLIAHAVGEADWSRAAAIAEESLSVEPAELESVDGSRPALSAHAEQLARLFSTIHLVRADLLERAGRRAEAHEERRRGEELSEAVAD